jgi:methanethiol S-methyltransferase
MPRQHTELVKRLLAFAYGLVAYLLGIRAMLYFVGFASGFLVPRDVDTVAGAVPAHPARALLANAGLVLLFAAVHSLLARREVKRRLARWLPASLERSTYTLVSSLLLMLLMWQWRALPAPVWTISAEPARIAIRGIAILGWVAAVVSLQTLGHLDLFGLRQAWRVARGRDYTAPGLTRRLLYSRVRHPVYLGSSIGWWATPDMSLGHLLLASTLTLYVAFAWRLEERELLARYGAEYQDYRRHVPAFLPRWRASR